MGGAVATFVVLGAEVAEILRVDGGPARAAAREGADPVPQRRLAREAGARDAARVHARAPTTTAWTSTSRRRRSTPPRGGSASAAWWRSRCRSRSTSSRAATAAATSSSRSRASPTPIGGPLIGTTLWSGPAFRDVLADAQPLPRGPLRAPALAGRLRRGRRPRHDRVRPAHRAGLRWNGQPLPAEHGFPLRVYVPDLYGMKQPKWIDRDRAGAGLHPRLLGEARLGRTGATAHHLGDRHRRHRATCSRRGGKTFVPVGGIADAGARGISKVEVQVDGGPWEAAELRPPLLRPHLGDLALRLALARGRARLRRARLRWPGPPSDDGQTRRSLLARPASTPSRRPSCRAERRTLPCAILGAMSSETPPPAERGDFIREIVAADLREGRHQTVVTRFPPSRTATCTSATRSRSVSTSASPRSSAAATTCASTTRTP